MLLVTNIAKNTRSGLKSQLKAANQQHSVLCHHLRQATGKDSTPSSWECVEPFTVCTVWSLLRILVPFLKRLPGLLTSFMLILFSLL